MQAVSFTLLLSRMDMTAILQNNVDALVLNVEV